MNSSTIGITEGEIWIKRATGETVTIKSVHRFAVRVHESAIPITAIVLKAHYDRA